jgi:hypothetical protein
LTTIMGGTPPNPVPAHNLTPQERVDIRKLFEDTAKTLDTLK